jgi:hypothetical protein
MLVGMHIYDGDAATMRRQRSAVAALGRLPGVEAVNFQFRSKPWSTLEGIEMMPLLEQDSVTTAGPGGRRKPLTRELFDLLERWATSRGHRYFAYINSDIVILPAAIEEIERLGRETYAISRHDIAQEDEATGGRLLTAGIDMFAVRPSWWQSHRRRFRPYVIGDACWDNVYAAVMMCHSDGVVLNRERLILHERHAALWHDATATARYNGFMAALDARYFSLWCNYWARLEQGRARGASAAEEHAFRDDVFVWRRSLVAAMRQSIRSLRARIHYWLIRRSACGPREESESSSATARASGGGAPRALKEVGQVGRVGQVGKAD